MPNAPLQHAAGSAPTQPSGDHSTSTEVIQNMGKGASAPGAGLAGRCGLLAQNKLLKGPVVGLDRRDGARALRDAAQITAQLACGKHEPGSIAQLPIAVVRAQGLDPQHLQDTLQIADQVASAINQGKWSAITVWADEDNRKTQLVDVGASPATYVAELLDLSTGSNSLAPGSEAIRPSHMNAIGEMTFSIIETAGLDRVRVLGSVYSPKGWLNAAMLLDLSTPGKPVLTGGVG